MSLIAGPEHYMEPQLGLSVNASWHEAIHWPGAKQTGYVVKIFDSLSAEQFNALEPARDIISSPANATEDVLSFEADRSVAGMITDGHYWVYSGWGDAFSVDLDNVVELWGVAGVNATAQWFDPRTAELQVIGSFVVEGNRTFTPPSHGGVDFDWVLIIKSAKSDC